MTAIERLKTKYHELNKLAEMSRKTILIETTKEDVYRREAEDIKFLIQDFEKESNSVK